MTTKDSAAIYLYTYISLKYTSYLFYAMKIEKQELLELECTLEITFYFIDKSGYEVVL